MTPRHNISSEANSPRQKVLSHLLLPGPVQFLQPAAAVLLAGLAAAVLLPVASLLLAQAPAAPLCRQCCPSSCAAGWSCSCAGDCRPLSPLFLALFFCRCTFPPAVAAPFLPCTFFLSSRREDEPGLRVLQRWSSHRASIIDGHALRIRPAGRIFQSYVRGPAGILFVPAQPPAVSNSCPELFSGLPISPMIYSYNYPNS